MKPARSRFNLDECLIIADSYSWMEIAEIGEKQGIADIGIKGPNKLYGVMKIKQNGGQIAMKNAETREKAYQI